MQTLRASRSSTVVAAILLINMLLSATQKTLAEGHTQAFDAVNAVIPDLMVKHDIPGMAVAISYRGEDHFHNFGVMDRKTSQAVTPTTLFEVGSISKLFSATLAAYLEQRGALSLDAPIEAYLDELQGYPLGAVPVFHLATHTAGGFPLQLPSDIESVAALTEYYQNWQPDYAMGTHRSYANPSVGLLGVLTARVMQADFADLIEQELFAAMGLGSTYINLPDEVLGNYAWGYTRDNSPVHVNPALLANEAYAVKTTSADLLEFLKLSLAAGVGDSPLDRAIRRTHIGFVDTGFFQQAMVWERYSYPLDLPTLKAGNSNRMILETTPVEAVEPGAAGDAYLLSKTGSTNGFGAYVFAIPSEDFALVLLANKYYPNTARVEAAYKIASEALSLGTKPTGVL